MSGLSQSNGSFNFYYQVPPLGRYLYLVAQGGTTGAAPAVSRDVKARINGEARLLV